MTVVDKVPHLEKTRTAANYRETAGVIAAPPVLFGVALMLAIALHLFVYRLDIAQHSSRILRAAALAPIVGGLLLSSTVMRVFGAAGTPVPPYRPTTRLVTRGPYRYTRNPDYIGQTLLYVGIAIAVNSWWPLLLLPLVLLAVQRGVVLREERYLEAKFGREYRDYKAMVRRWL